MWLSSVLIGNLTLKDLLIYYCSYDHIMNFITDSNRLNSYDIDKRGIQQLVPLDAAKKLKEWAIAHVIDSVDYELIGMSGPAHSRSFVIQCQIKNMVTKGR